MAKQESFQIKGRIQSIPSMEFFSGVVIDTATIKRLGDAVKGRFLAAIKGTGTENEPYSCALMPIKGGKRFLLISKQKMKAYNLELGQQVAVRLTVDRSKYGMPMVHELLEVFKIDKEAKRRFHLLTPGKQRNIIHYVSSAKNPDVRANRAVTLLDRLKATTEGKENIFQMMSSKGPVTSGDNVAAMKKEKAKSLRQKKYVNYEDLL
jgi:hypothetical protein